MKKMPRWLAVVAALLLPFAALAQQKGLDIDIIGGNASATPITVVPMPYQGSAGAPQTDVASVVRADLERSGQFRTLPEAQIVEKPSRGSEIQFATWRALKQNYIVVGRVMDAGAGAYRVEYELYDVPKGERLLGLAMTARGNAMRDVAHQMADAIYEKITGVRGAFWTRIAYVTASGKGDAMRYALMVADSDGFNPQTIVRSAEPLLSPSWSPDGNRLAYVSFERGNSAIYIQNISTGARELVTSFRGINSAPSFSPDGRRLALSLSRSGNPEIYVMDLGSKQLTQLTNHFAIDTEPTWSADGSNVYFTSDRGGSPQIYRLTLGSGAVERLTFDGSYNVSPRPFPDGKGFAFVRRDGARFQIAVQDFASRQVQVLTAGPLDESPSVAPNGKLILYANEVGGRGILAAVSSDGRVKQRLVAAGTDVREPAWGPIPRP